MSGNFKEIAFLILSLILASGIGIFCINYYTVHLVFGLTEKVNSTIHAPINLQKIETKKVHVGDIDMDYKIFGKGKPLILINGFSVPLDFWDPTLLQNLAYNHTVITFDNRGIGNSTSGDKNFTIAQFANDTTSLMDAINIKKADVMGWSMGGMIAQELALIHPDKVDKLIIYGSTCGGRESKQPSPNVSSAFENLPVSNQERLKKFMPFLFPEKWIADNPDSIQHLPMITGKIPIETLKKQTGAIINWVGTCDRLNKISNPTLVVVGTKDVITVPANSLMIAEKIPGAWLIQIQGGGHALMFQYPEEFSRVILTFLQS